MFKIQFILSHFGGSNLSGLIEVGWGRHGFILNADTLKGRKINLIKASPFLIGLMGKRRMAGRGNVG